MAHGKRDQTQSLDKQVYEALRARQAFGRSKHQDKLDEARQGLERGSITRQYIYSFSAAKDYQRHCMYFVNWCKSNEDIRAELGHKPRTLDECKAYVESFIRAREAEGKSAYTVKLEKSAIEKMYGEQFDFSTKSVARQDITRSRGKVARDKHFSEERNAALVNFCRCVGPRRDELTRMRAEDLRLIDGKPYIEITGKGGKTRLAPVIGTAQEVEEALDFLSKLDGKNHIHNAADIHGYRADYATRIYEKFARDIDSIKGKRFDYTAITGKHGKGGTRIEKDCVYYCRGDKKGTALDREAMLEASKALGHNREDVVAGHYIRTKKETDGEARAVST